MYISVIEDKSQYERLVASYGSVFNSSDWLNIFGEKVNLYGIYDNGKNLIGAFHLFEYKKVAFNFIINPPFTPHIGLFFINQTSNRSNDNSFNKEIVNALATFFTAKPHSLLSISLPNNIIDTQPFQWKGFKVRPQYSYIIDLRTETEVLWQNLSSQRRKSIRKAGSDSLTVVKADDYKLVYNLVKKTFSRQEKPLDLILVEKILFNYANEKNSYAFITYSGNEPIAGTFCIHDKKSAYYIFGGYDDALKHHGAGPAAMWESIQQAQKLGLEKFDFEGSMIPNVEEYFREFGGKLVPFYNVSKTKWPLKIIKS